MKVHNSTIFMGDTGRSERHGNMTADEKKSGSTIFAGSLNKTLDPIAQKKKEARKQAMKIVSDTWAGDKKIDSDLEERRNKIAELRSEIGQARSAINDIEAEREKLREAYGVEADSQEEKDLKLLEKEIDAKIPGSNVSISKEEAEKIEELKAAGLTEYQKRSLEMKEETVYYENQVYEKEKEIEVENAVIRGTRLERLKKDPMVKAQAQAEDILEAASKEIIGMLADEAKEHIDEEMEEKKEAAKEKAEEEKELEEKLEKIKEKKKEREELTEDILEAAGEMVQLDDVQSEVQQEIKDLVSKMKLLEEDIKGAAVDKTL
ncbi:MAG: hypothetical protein J6C64_09455 [Lachnospiraceae bacterium]|nr:hypothetical protein [Lachnospiraceae bacterium]